MVLNSLSKYWNALVSRPAAVFTVMFIVVLCSRIPFITDSYGIDGDGWRVINVAKTIGATHQYIASRFPGYPFFELSLAACNAPPAWITNTMTAVLSSIAAAFFTLLVRHFSTRYMAAGIAFAFTPIVFINSIVTMDYLWALCFILIALYLCIVRRSLLIGGICIGVATGCRMTSILMALPLLLLLLRNKEWKESRRFLIAAVVTCAILYLPVMTRYGFSFLSFTEGSYSFASVLKKLTIDSWGITGFFFLIVAILSSRRSAQPVIPKDHIQRLHYPVFGAILLYILLFLRLPVDAGYLIPCIPMAILILSVNAPGTMFRWFTAAMVASSFLISFSPADRPWHPTPSPWSMALDVGGRTMVVDLLFGPVIKERDKMNRQNLFLSDINAFLDHQEHKTVLLAGDFVSKIVTRRGISLSEHTVEDYYEDKRIVIAAYADRSTLHKLKSEGYRMFHLPDVGKINEGIYGVSPESFGSRNIFAETKTF